MRRAARSSSASRPATSRVGALLRAESPDRDRACIAPDSERIVGKTQSHTGESHRADLLVACASQPQGSPVGPTMTARIFVRNRVKPGRWPERLARGVDASVAQSPNSFYRK